MPRNRLLISAACLVFLFGCASRQKADAPPPAAASSSSQPATSAKAERAASRPGGRRVKSKDGKTSGEIVGTPAANSKFAKVEIGMNRFAVERLIGGPDDAAGHITGRQFTPFYFGGDTQRYEAFYKGEGQLTYTNTSMAGTPETLIIITVNTKATGLSRR